MLCPHLSHIYSCLLSVISAASVSLLITSLIWCHVFINWTSEFKNGLITLRVDLHYQNGGCIMCRVKTLYFSLLSTHTHTLVLLYLWGRCWLMNYLEDLPSSILRLTTNLTGFFFHKAQFIVFISMWLRGSLLCNFYHCLQPKMYGRCGRTI